MRGIIPRRNNLQNAQAVAAIGDKRESSGVHHADFYVVHVVQLMVGVEELIEFRSFRIFDVDDAQAVFSGGDVGVSPREINVTGIVEREFGVGDRLGMREVGGVEYFEADAVNNECVAELHGNAARV